MRGGCEALILSDEAVGPDRAPIPMILAMGAVHSHLVRQGLRSFSYLIARSGECLDTHYFAVLIGVGATAVNAYLAEAAIADRHARGLFPGLDLEDCLARFKEAINQGLLKVMSKMGISIISSYRGGYNFEAVGLSRSLCREYFPGLTTRISGIGLTGIKKKVRGLHARAFAAAEPPLAIGGFYRYRRGGETHTLEAKVIHQLQHAVASDSYHAFKQYTEMLQAQDPISIRDLLDFNRKLPPVPLDEVESITEIRKRFVTPGMSLGALSPEAHETLTIAMNRIGARSDSGEGGEGKERFHPRPNGDNANSPIKQVASGRFGVTAEYLNAAKELEIKVAQGAKPGEGGQLPGFKVTLEIARLRHATPGVTLISPPPHHDIYSIEDLAQLIYDLKQINPDARVGVKLVSEAGIGTIAAGVAKAKADVILVAGHVGGTGASPQTSIKYAGTPWEMGLSEVNQILTLNRLRHRVTLRTDGGIKTGRDVVIAALLGAEEYGIGTLSLVAMGCILVRQCHSNTCPVGVCTQRPDLRERFTGTPEKVINLMSFIAEEVREVLASLGLRTLEEAVGRADLLRQVGRGDPDLDDLDLNPLLAQIDPGQHGRVSSIGWRNEVPDTLDARMVEDARPMLEDGEKMQLAYNVRNVHRAVGTRISAEITRRYGMDQLAPGHLTVRLRGSTGQSLGRLRRPGPQARGVRRRQRLCRQGPVRRHHRRPPAALLADRLGRQRHHRQHLPLRRHRRPAVRRRPRRRALRRPQLRCDHRGRGLRRQWLRVHDRRRRRPARPGRRQLRRRHERRHGLRLGPEGPARGPHQRRHGHLPAPRGAPLHRPAPHPGHRAPRRHPEPARRAHPARVRPRARPFLAGRAQGDAGPAGGAGAGGGGGAAGLSGGLAATRS